MGTQIASLYASLTLESSSFISSLKKSVGEVQKSAGAIEKSLAGIKASAGLLAGALSLNFLSEGVKSALEFAGSIGEVSQQLGVSTKDLQAFRFAGSQVGVSADEMDGALSKLTKTIGLATTGGKEQQRVFQVLGVSVRDASGQIKPTGEILREVADRLTKVKDPAQRAAVEIALFGKTGQKLDTLLADGSRAIDDMAESARKLGLVLSDDQIKHADDAADKLSALHQVLSYRIATTVADNAKSILTLADSVGTVLTQAVKFGDWLANHPVAGQALFGAAIGGRAGLPGAVIGAGIGALRARDNADPTMAQFDDQIGFLEKQIAGAGGPGNVVNAGLVKRLNAIKAQRDSEMKSTFDSIWNAPLTDSAGKAIGSSLDLGALHDTGEQANKYKAALADLTKQSDELGASTKALNADFSPDQIEFATFAAKVDADVKQKSVGLSNAQASALRAEGEELKREKLANLDSKRSFDIRNQSIENLNDTMIAFRQSTEEAAKAATELGDEKALRSLQGSVNTTIRTWENATEEALRPATQFGEDLSSALGQAVAYGQSLGDALKNSIRSAAAELIASGLLNLFLGSKDRTTGLRSGGILTSAINAIGASFGGARASGGPVSSNSLYLVGERGPEFFRPGANGTIIPNSAMKSMASNGNGGSGGSVTIEHVFKPSPYLLVESRQAGAVGGTAAVAAALKEARKSRIYRP